MQDDEFRKEIDSVFSNPDFKERFGQEFSYIDWEASRKPGENNYKPDFEEPDDDKRILSGLFRHEIPSATAKKGYKIEEDKPVFDLRAKWLERQNNQKKPEQEPVFGQPAGEAPKPEFKETFGTFSGEAPKSEAPKPEMPKPEPQQTFGQEKPSAETPKPQAPHFTRIMDFFAPAPRPAAPAIPKGRPQSIGEHKGGAFNAAYKANKGNAYIPNVTPNLNADYQRDQDLLQKEINRYKDAVAKNVKSKYHADYKDSPIELFNNPERFNRLVNLVHGNPRPAEIPDYTLPKFEDRSFDYDATKDFSTALATEHGPLYTKGERVLDQSLIETDPRFIQTLKQLGNRNKELQTKIAPEKFKEEKSAAQSLYNEEIKKLGKPVENKLRRLMNKYFEKANEEYSKRIDGYSDLLKRKFNYPDDFFPVETRDQYLKDDPDQAPRPGPPNRESPTLGDRTVNDVEQKIKDFFGTLGGGFSPGIPADHPGLPKEEWKSPDHEPRRKVRDEEKIKKYQKEQRKKLLDDYNKANFPYTLENDYQGLEHYLTPEDLKDYYYAFNAFHDLPYSEPPKENLLDYFVQQRQNKMKNAFNTKPHSGKPV